jgi:hypothetical protein
MVAMLTLVLWRADHHHRGKCVVAAAAADASSDAAVKKKTWGKEDFLYHTDEAAGIIVDYEPEEGEKLNRPDFIYGANQGPRVVEYYAPWCPHVSTTYFYLQCPTCQE